MLFLFAKDTSFIEWFKSCHQNVLITIPNDSCIGAAPFESLSIADIGDVRMNIYDMQEAVKDIRSHFTEILSTGCKTIALGGDHTISYPILQAIKVRGSLATRIYCIFT